MLRREDVMVIQALAQRGLYLCDIANQVGVHPRTVRRALTRGGAPAPRPSRRGSRLDPYRADIDQLLAEDVWNAVVIFRELQAKGYTGRLSILRDYIRPKRVLRVRRATVRFETPPGRQLQSDWAEQRTRIAGEETTVHFLVNTLGFSRRFHFWCTDSQDAEHTYDGLIRSFEWFAGVPAEVLVDNQKAAVLEHPRGDLPGSIRGLWIWRDTMGLCPVPADPRGRKPRAKMSAWWATSNTTSLSATVRSRAGRT
jgi:transposase